VTVQVSVPGPVNEPDAHVNAVSFTAAKEV
jgi:hypothetical protein